MFALIDLSYLMRNVRLKIIDTFGDYKLKKFNALQSDSLIMICNQT